MDLLFDFGARVWSPGGLFDCPAGFHEVLDAGPVDPHGEPDWFFNCAASGLAIE
jgi:hypothetical protein